MSVILDALKRVQDENRRRGVGAEPPHPRTARNSSRLMRRLSASSERPAGATEGTWSPMVSFGLLVVTLVGIIAGALWWFEPTFTGPSANGGRPLLSELSAAQRSPATPQGSPASTPAVRGSITEGFAAVDSRVASPGQAGNVAAAAAADTPASDASPLRDLSARLPGNGAAESSGGVLQLETSRSAGAAGRDDGFIDLSTGGGRQSSAGANTGADARMAAAESGAAPPARLVDPGVKTAFRQGVQAQKAGDLGTAEDAYKRALKYDPDNARVNANLGVLYEELNRLSLAERHLRRAIGIEPKNAGAHNNLGVVLYRQGNYDAALIEFKRTLALDSQRLDAYTNMGLIYTRWGQYDEAQLAFRQVIGLDPENALAHYNLGLVCEETEQLDCALHNYYEFLALGGEDHPRIAEYLVGHLDWLEARVGQVSGQAQR